MQLQLFLVRGCHPVLFIMTIIKKYQDLIMIMESIIHFVEVYNYLKMSLALFLQQKNNNSYISQLKMIVVFAVQMNLLNVN